MKRNFYYLIAVMLMAVPFISCSSDDENVKAEEVSSPFLKAPYYEISQNDIPQWVSIIIEQIQQNYTENKELSEVMDFSTYLASQPSIYQCTWKDKTYYFVYSKWNSCVYCNSVFNPDGTTVEWESTEETIEFANKSTDWKCIFNPF